MKTITLKINERTKAGKAVLAMLGFFTEEKNGVEIIVTPKTIEKPRYNAQTEKAIQDARNGIGITVYKNSNDIVGLNAPATAIKKISKQKQILQLSKEVNKTMHKKLMQQYNTHNDSNYR